MGSARKSKINDELRSARRGRKLTQQQVAEAIGGLLGRAYDTETVGRLERGVIRWPNHEVRAAFRTYFKADSDAALGFYSKISAADTSSGSNSLVSDSVSRQLPADGEITVPARGPGGRIIFVRITRRAFLEGAAAFGFTVSPAIRSVAIPFGNGSDSEVHPIEHFAQVERAITDTDNMFGPRQVIDIALQQVELMKELRGELRGTDRIKLIKVETQYADLLAWFYQDSGDFMNSRQWADRSLELSHLGRDSQATAFMLARRSQLAADLRNHGDAVDAAEAAVELARPGSRVEAIACTYAGYGHALQGNADNSARLYARASEYLESDEVDQYIYGDFFNASYLNVHQAHSSVVLGKPGAAASMFRSAIAELPDSFHRDRGVYLAMEAHAHAEGCELEEAVLVGFRALSVAHETGSARILRELAQVDSSLARRQSVPEVRSFRAALTEMLPRLA